MHEGGTVQDEKDHITAQLFNKGGKSIPSSWIDKKTSQVKTGTMHHVYPKGHELGAQAWENHVKAHETQAEAEKTVAVDAKHAAWRQGLQNTADEKRRKGLEAQAKKKAAAASQPQDGYHSDDAPLGFP
jgi:hypothetical protein